MMAARRHSADDRDARRSDPTAVDPSPFDAATDPATGRGARTDNGELLPGTVVGDTYEVDARLGAGAMGEVYAARHMRLGKRVAIKVISQRLSEDDDALARFALEARTLALIQHPAIVAVDHVGELTDGRAYFVMEFLRGTTLFEHLQRGRAPLPEALRILDQMARGLDAAHGEGVTHRDLKPENTFLVHLPGEPPAVKLVDFGLAKLRSTDDRRAERTQSGVAIGTPMYMSPEQMRGANVDHRTDIYALGCVAYELVLGRALFPHADTAPELYAAHLHEAPPLPRTIWPEIPPQLDLMLFAMVAKDPAHRPTLEQVRAVIAGTRPIAAAPHAATTFVRPRAWTPRVRQLAIGVLVLVALTSGLAIGLGMQGPSNARPTVTPTASPAPRQPAPARTAPAQPEAAVTAPAIEVAPPAPPSPRQERPRSDTPRRPAKPRSDRAAPVDANARVPATTVPPPPPAKARDRNQTINPFTKQRPQVNP